MASNFAWGIDVGNRALKAVKIVREGNELRVDDFEVIEHETVLSNAGDNKESLIQTALANFVQRHPFKGGQVGIGVSGQSSFARFIKLPPVEPKKIPEIVRFEAIQQIPFPLDDVEWSYQLFQAAESPDIEVGIFAMRKELVNHQIKFYTDFDLNVQVVQMNPLAVYNAMYHDSRLDGTTMVIDLGAENTDLIICDHETIWMRSIPIGGNSFTEALVKAFKLPFNKAEDLKRNAATSKYARQIFQAMRPIFADLVAEIQRSVGFYASVHRDSRIKKVLALGGTFKLPGLQKYLHQNLQLEVERLDTLAAAPSSESKLAPTFNENILSVVGAYGLAIQAMGEAKVTSSLLPAKIRREKLWKEKTPLFAAAAALFVAGLGISVATWWMDDLSIHSSSAQNAYQDVVATRNKAKELDGKWNTVQQSGEGDRQQIVNIRSLLDYRMVWPNLITEIEKTLPQSGDDAMSKQLASHDPAVIKQIPRQDRKLILVDNIKTEYRPDITNLISAQDISNYANISVAPVNPNADEAAVIDSAFQGEGAEQQPAVVAAPPPPPPRGKPILRVATGAPRGFVLTIHFITPNKNVDEIVRKELLPALQKIKPNESDPLKPFSILKAQRVTAYQIRELQPRKSELVKNFKQLNGSRPAAAPAPAGSAVPPVVAGGGAPAAAPNSDDAAYLDRLTGESVLDDWDVTVVALVELDPEPYSPPTPAPGAQANAEGSQH